MKNSRASKQRPTRWSVRKPENQKLSKFATKLFREWKRLALPQSSESVVVAISGGADSTALLLALDELINSGRLKVRMIAAHLNHKLRGQAGASDARWVASFVRKLGHNAIIESVDVPARVRKTQDNLEQAARRARYDFLERVALAGKCKAILTAHTLDDQAETVLLNLLRGSGARGLSGIEPRRRLAAGGETLLARPLVSWARRADTQNYCREREIDFRVDAMNADETFARVRVRNQLIPLLTSFNPRIVESLARSAEILREDSAALESAATRLLEQSIEGPASRELSADLLRLAPPALRRRALRMWIAACRGDLRRLEFAHILALEKFLFSTKSGREIELPGGGKVRRKGGRFHYSGSRQ